MEYDLMSVTGYVYPNETVMEWSVLIANYPYMTGLVAGAFSVSSFAHVFGMKRFEPVARFALLAAFAFMIFVPTNLLIHLGHPERAFNAMLTPHWSSAFAMFGFFAAFYTVLLAIEIWFAFREDIVRMSRRVPGLLGQFYKLLTLGSDEISARSRAFDARVKFWLAVIGIPSAHGLHGYIGFVFGSVKAREWWSSDMMPVIFIFSAIVSGVSVMIVLYMIACWVRNMRINEEAVRGMAWALWGFLMFNLVLELVEFGTMVYKGLEGIDWIMEFVNSRLIITFFVLQLSVGSVLPIVILSLLSFLHIRGKPFLTGAFISSCLVLLAVFMMRWNVVIGGQEISKTGKGLLTYHPYLWGTEGLLMVVAILGATMAFFVLLLKILPPWADMDGSEEGGGEAGEDAAEPSAEEAAEATAEGAQGSPAPQA